MSHTGDRILNTFLNRVLGVPEDVMVCLGSEMQEGSIYVRVEARGLWQRLSRGEQLRTLVRGRWTPTDDFIRAAAEEELSSRIFGGSEDFGDHLLHLNSWHQSQQWDFGHLTGADQERADALELFTVLTRLRLQDAHGHPALSLRLLQVVPDICILVYPMVVKIPVVAMRFFLDLHATFAFNAIRASGHPHADELIAYLYDVLYLQQKTAIALHEYVRLAAYAASNKRGASLINAEVNAIMQADLVFAYLKASVEKIIAVLGATFEMTGLDAKKTHKAKLAALKTGLPAEVLTLPYGQQLLELTTSESLEDLNSYRSGLLHKKGIADLQPHNYVGRSAQTTPLEKIHGVLFERHAKNTVALLSALAVLTDDLVRRDPPKISMSDIPIWSSEPT